MLMVANVFIPIHHSVIIELFVVSFSDFFSGFSWSSDETKLAYIAEPKEKKNGLIIFYES